MRELVYKSIPLRICARADQTNTKIAMSLTNMSSKLSSEVRNEKMDLKYGLSSYKAIHTQVTVQKPLPHWDGSALVGVVIICVV